MYVTQWPPSDPIRPMAAAATASSSPSSRTAGPVSRSSPIWDASRSSCAGLACAPRSKRAFAHWARSTLPPELMGFSAPQRTSQRLRDEMHTLPLQILGAIEQRMVRELIRIERLQAQALAFAPANFYTHLAATRGKPQSPQGGHNQQERQDLRQRRLALVVDSARRSGLCRPSTGIVVYTEGAPV